MRICPHCGARNWTPKPNCDTCGKPMGSAHSAGPPIGALVTSPKPERGFGNAYRIPPARLSDDR